MSEKSNITLSFDFKLNWPNLSFQWYLDRKCSHKWVIRNYQRYVAIWPHATFYSLRKQSAWIVYLAPFQTNITVLIWGSIIISRRIIKVLCPSNLKPNPSSLDISFFFLFLPSGADGQLVSRIHFSIDFIPSLIYSKRLTEAAPPFSFVHFLSSKPAKHDVFAQIWMDVCVLLYSLQPYTHVKTIFV